MSALLKGNRARPAFRYLQMVQRDKASRDIFWLKDERREIVESLETAREQFRGIEDELKDGKTNLK